MHSNLARWRHSVKPYVYFSLNVSFFIFLRLGIQIDSLFDIFIQTTKKTSTKALLGSCSVRAIGTVDVPFI